MSDRSRYGKIGVLMGGPSSEREISLKSGKAVFESLKGQSFDVVPIDIKTDRLKENTELILSSNIDCAFIALHGSFGEDGRVQSMLESLKIPYTGSGVKASELAMDKVESKSVFRKGSLVVPRDIAVKKADFRKDTISKIDFDLPWVIKPVNCGSSIGLTIVDKTEDFQKAMELAFGFDERVLIEEYIAGREITVGLLDESPLPVIEIIPKRRFFDFHAKYQHGLTEYVVPAKIDEGIARRAQEAALKAYNLLGCSGCARVDIILDRQGSPFILEINTIPGLTSTSLLPKAAKFEGIDFDQLCLKILASAYEEK